MTAIRIERTTDWHDCEDCGLSEADGARVFFDGVPKLNLKPIAHCFDGVGYDDEDIAREILRELGSGVVYSTEHGYFSRTLKSLGHKVQVVDVPRH
ncbi:hypothetical protein HFO56_03195 [Rhizobium laguerreae]|uniref:hypothetical protein n=1 Tax=Rhizobium laguerreae TaxID=1076926 RepID=UPI001C92268C|nr:hypothetical protein [Rhizobium laguerreae]MBY3151393.1 hypothetical protein [Rhizobium laguerreae]